MFFRKKAEAPSKPISPIVSKDGKLYVEEGQSYDEDEYETDSSYSESDDSDHGMQESDEEESSIANGIVEGEEKKCEFEPGKDVNEKEQEESDVGNDDENSREKQLQYATQLNDIVNDQKISNGETDHLLNEIDVLQTNTVSDTNIDRENLTEPPEKSKVVSDTEKTKATEPTISEKRSLLALAAEQDRVDVIKNILQPLQIDESTTCDSSALVQLMLNNRTNEKDDKYGEDDVEKIFLPPLHLAIASSATNAACCLLRMGADPSIRPFIPENWSPNYKTVDNMGPSVVVHNCSMFHGLSAWELAFGTSKTRTGVAVLEKAETKEGWFHRSSKKTIRQEKNSPLNISPSKLEGIRNAFMAEALRAIGSDEVTRLRELINSGIDNTGKESSYHNERIEVGGKDLLGWCATMNAVKCSNMLETVYGKSSNGQENGIHETKAQAREKNEDENKTIVPSSDPDLSDLQAQLEQSESLAMALSSMLDELAEEVSDLQGLMFENGQPSNSALLSQIRSLKEVRGQRDDELVALENTISDLETELRMVLMWWRNRGGEDDDILSVELEILIGTKQKPTGPELENEKVEVEEKVDRTKELKEKIALTENNIEKMRTKISDLAEEKSQGMNVVEKMGISGAIKLSRSLREEILEKEYALENAKKVEVEYLLRIKLARDRLENKANEAHSAQDGTVKEDPSGTTCVEDKSEQGATENGHSKSVDEPSQSLDVNYEEEMELIDVELRNGYASDKIDENELDEDIAPSEVISKGESTAIVPRVDGWSHLSVNIWNLLVRIISLGRDSFQQAVSTTANESYSNVMIV